MFPSTAEVERKLSSNIQNNLPRQTWILTARNQLFFFYCVETLYNTAVSVRWDNIIITLRLND